MKRVTITVRSGRGRRYLYDDKTGCILPWSDLREAILRSKCAAGAADPEPANPSADPGDVAAETRFITEWFDKYGAFMRASDKPAPVPSADALVALVGAHSSQLNLTVTEACNLRCRHCVFSGAYLYTRTHSAAVMSPERAMRALDWYVELIEPQRRQQRSKVFGLSFWGGEPLLNVAAIRAVLERVRTLYPGLFAPTMTTNGTLLTRANVALLVDHQVNLVVSIDGHAAEHDRRRVYASGRGSLDLVLANLRRIKRDHPAYWADRMSTHPVYDASTDLVSVAEFFEQHADVVPRVATIGGVSLKDLVAGGTDRSSDGGAEYVGTVGRLRSDFDRAKTTNGRMSTYTEAFGNLEMSGLLFRSRYLDRSLPFMPFTGNCLPGHRVTVRVDGTLDLCERVNQSFPIGHLESGVDGERIRALLDETQTKLISGCYTCPATRMCRVCFAQTLGNGCLEDLAEQCQASRRAAVRALQRFVTIMETNPQAALQTEWPEFAGRPGDGA